MESNTSATHLRAELKKKGPVTGTQEACTG
jgi:hypothetical protein